MSYGLRVHNGAGNIILDTSDRLTRVGGVITLTTSSPTSGSFTGLDIFNTGTPWYYITLTSYDYTNMIGVPSVTISGTTLSYSQPSGYPIPCTILYGVY